MTPKQHRQEVYEQMRLVDAQIIELSRRWPQMDPDEHDRERVRLLNLRDTLTARLSELHDRDDADD
jgi:hypothetical protein